MFIHIDLLFTLLYQNNAVQLTIVVTINKTKYLKKKTNEKDRLLAKQQTHTPVWQANDVSCEYLRENLPCHNNTVLYNWNLFYNW